MSMNTVAMTTKRAGGLGNDVWKVPEKYNGGGRKNAANSIGCSDGATILCSDV